MPRSISKAKHYRSGMKYLTGGMLSRSGVILKIQKGLSFRSAALSREESAVSLPTSRFLADRPGFGMTNDKG
jgi:hypothetical protein